MTEKTSDSEHKQPESISEDDVIEGMRELQGYFDMTPHDFKMLYEKVHAFSKKRLMREVLARDIMKQPVFTVNASDTIETLIGLLAEKNVSGVPVTGGVGGGGRVVGVVSEKDILTLLGKSPNAHLMQLVADVVLRSWGTIPNALETEVSEIMTIPALTVNEDCDLGELMRIFNKKIINRVPVVNKDGSAVGIITRSDIITAVSELL